MKIDLKRREVLTRDGTIFLTKIQSQILKVLLKNNNQIVKTEEIIRNVYQIRPDESSILTLRKHISLLNKKISNYIKIKNIPNVGYCINNNIDKKANDDLQYIKTDIVAKRINGNYCRFSKILNGVTNSNISYEDYLKYWERNYRNYDEWLPIIIEACKEKLANNLTSNEDFIELVRKSNEKEEEKRKIIKSLGGRF